MTNWAKYDAGLRARGSLTVWFTPKAVEAWKAEPRTGRGGQPTYSALAIATATGADSAIGNRPLPGRRAYGPATGSWLDGKSRKSR